MSSAAFQKIAVEAPAQLQRVDALRRQARDLLASNAEQLDELREEVEGAAALDSFLRAAKPAAEPSEKISL